MLNIFVFFVVRGFVGMGGIDSFVGERRVWYGRVVVIFFSLVVFLSCKLGCL